MEAISQSMLCLLQRLRDLNKNLIFSTEPVSAASLSPLGMAQLLKAPQIPGKEYYDYSRWGILLLLSQINHVKPLAEHQTWLSLCHHTWVRSYKRSLIMFVKTKNNKIMEINPDSAEFWVLNYTARLCSRQAVRIQLLTGVHSSLLIGMVISSSALCVLNSTQCLQNNLLFIIIDCFPPKYQSSEPSVWDSLSGKFSSLRGHLAVHFPNISDAVSVCISLCLLFIALPPPACK